MMRGLLILFVGGVCLLTAGGSQAQPPVTESWRTKLSRSSLAFGHRNWIVIADAAYPAQTSPGIETVVTSEEHLDVLKRVLELLADRKHVRPVVYLDAELAHVTEADAPGIDKLRAGLKEQLAGYRSPSLPHEEILARLDKAGEKFKVLVLKTTARVPYTSVFLELDCGYWSPEAEKRLRETMKKAPQQ